MAHPSEPSGVLIHRRTYDVDVYRERSDLMRLRGAVIDEKPAGLHFQGDPEPLPMHHMVVDLFVAVPSLVITEVGVVFETHPHGHCPQIVDAYDQLVGVPILRGFSGKVRELFGGPRGCTHTNALLQAMAPVVVQSMWSMEVLERGSEPVPLRAAEAAGAGASAGDDRSPRWRGTVNSCHVWDADGTLVRALEAGEPMVPPQPFLERAVQRGVPESEWREQFDP